MRTRAGCGTSGLQAALGGGGALALALLVGTACREDCRNIDHLELRGEELQATALCSWTISHSYSAGWSLTLSCPAQPPEFQVLLCHASCGNPSKPATLPNVSNLPQNCCSSPRSGAA